MWNMAKATLLASALVVCLAGQDISFSPQVVTPLSVPISRYTLKNGLEVILADDDSLPVVTVAVAYRVGSVNEPQRKSGLAYLLEDLMFQGSLNVSPMQHISYINRSGGETNAGTTQDVTMFYETVPSNQLALALWLESDRMYTLDITAANVERSRESIVEDIRRRKGNEPYLESFFIFDELVYADYAHQHPVVGYEADIKELTVEDVKDFYSTDYVPNNAVLVISGNFDKSKAREKVEQYFGSIPRGKDVPAPPLPDMGEKRETSRNIYSSLISSQAFHLAYRIAPPDSDDFPALTLVDYILIRGKRSRLQKNLLQKDYRLVSYLSGGIEKRSHSAVFKIFAVATNAQMAEESQRAINSEINKFMTGFISEAELAKAKDILKMDFINHFSTSLDKAVFLAEAFFTHPRFDEILLDLDKVLRVTPEEISRIIHRYFIPKNRVLLNVNKIQ